MTKVVRRRNVSALISCFGATTTIFLRRLQRNSLYSWFISKGLRDRALLCFGFASGGRRRSEIAAADLCDLRRIEPQGYSYRLEHSKTQQAGVTASLTPDKPILDRAVQALEASLAASGFTEGAIFRRLWKHTIGPALSPAAVAEIVQRRTRLAGLEGDFAAHSLRSGFVTEASRQGVSLPAIMQMTETARWPALWRISKPAPRPITQRRTFLRTRSWRRVWDVISLSLWLA